jgi:hypothetical protein
MVDFTYGKRIEARIYRHSDGYPEGLGADLFIFLRAVKSQTKDTRFTDPSYLAAKFVVWQAGEYADNKAKPLEFLSLGISMEYHGDLEYVYRVDCNNIRTDGLPSISVAEFHNGAPQDFKPLPDVLVEEAKS